MNTYILYIGDKLIGDNTKVETGNMTVSQLCGQILKKTDKQKNKGKK